MEQKSKKSNSLAYEAVALLVMIFFVWIPHSLKVTQKAHNER